MKSRLLQAYSERGDVVVWTDYHLFGWYVYNDDIVDDNDYDDDDDDGDNDVFNILNK